MALEPSHAAELRPEAGAEYARRLYDRVLAWYESAERKAQLILTLDGLFVSFLTASILRRPGELRSITERFGIETWLLFGLMSASLLLSIVSAVLCLRSRLYSERALQEAYREYGVRVEDADTYRPEVLWFFQHVGGLEPRALGDSASPSANTSSPTGSSVTLRA